MRNLTVAALVVIVALPLAFVVLQAIFPFIGRGSLSEPLSRVIPVLADPDLLRLTGNTLLLGIACVIGAAVLAVPLGALRALFAVPFARVFDVVFLIPFMIPPYIAALGWIMMLQPRGYLHQIAGFHLAPFLFSFWGVVFVMVLNVFPVVYFATSRTLALVGGRYGEIARVFGADPATAFRRITLPLATPGLAASLLLVFAMAIEEYGTPAALGARAGFFVLVTGIDTRVSDWPIDLPGAAILSLVLVLLSVGAFWLQLRIVARRSFEAVSGKPQPVVPRPLGRWRWPVLGYFLLAALLGTGLPLFAIVTAGLQNTISGGLALSNLGLQHFAAIVENRSGALRALTNSLALGIGTALLAGILGAAASYQVVRARLRGGAALDALTLMPNAMPSIVVAVGLILAWNNPLWPASPYNTPAILLLAYTCILLPYTVRYANAAFRQIGTSVEDAARVAGASPIVTFRRILLPLVAPSMIAAMLIVFAIASRELVASLLVAPVGMPTVATFIWRQFEQGSLGLGMAMSALAILVTTTIPVLVILAMRRRGAVDF